MSKIFQHCGWHIGGCFDSTKGMGLGKVKISSIFDMKDNNVNDEHADDLLDFVEHGR